MGRRLVQLALLAVIAFTLAANGATARSDGGRQLAGSFCKNANAMPLPGACIALSYDGQRAEGYTDSPARVLTLRPGTYWLTVDDTSTAHNFSLESPDAGVQDLTGVPDTPGQVTVKVNLTHGTWVLFCKPHRAMGMYVELEVGGVGQVGS